jgi:hypothetical protein
VPATRCIQLNCIWAEHFLHIVIETTWNELHKDRWIGTPTSDRCPSKALMCPIHGSVWLRQGRVDRPIECRRHHALDEMREECEVGVAARRPARPPAHTKASGDCVEHIACFHTDLGARGILSLLPNPPAADEKRRTIFDAKNLEPDPPQGTRVRGEEDPPVVAPHLMDSASMRVSAFLRRTG